MAKTIGILGGMGPEATAQTYLRMIRHSQNKYAAVQDEDYPQIIIHSITLDGFDETGIVDEQLVKDQLIIALKELENKCDVIVIPCNTVHYFLEELQNSIAIPIMNIILEVESEVSKAGYQKVGLLGSQSTKKLGLYKNVIQTNDLQQGQLNKIIKNVMGNNQGQEDILILKNIISEMKQKGAEAIVIGCTELPLAINQLHTDIKLFDSIDIIAKKAVDLAYK